jgi:uncharacterized membrane protein YbaN (DUF454 family)
VTPGLPTTPFILLTAFLFAKGSPKLHQKLLDNRLTGRYIRRVNDGFSIKGMAISIGIMWCMICFTVFVMFRNNETMRFVMFGLGMIGTVAQIIVLRKKKKRERIMLRIENEIQEEDMDKLKAS